MRRMPSPATAVHLDLRRGAHTHFQIGDPRTSVSDAPLLRRFAMRNVHFLSHPSHLGGRYHGGASFVTERTWPRTDGTGHSSRSPDVESGETS